MWQPRILIGTLYSGENEIEQCTKSLKKQKYTNWQHKIFSYLPNKEAHEALYNEFMSRADEFDLFIKLDADMVFQNDNSLNIIINLFEKYLNLDHAIIAVHDWFSNSLIMGLHVFSNRVWWKSSKEELFVDYNPAITGQKLVFWKGITPIALHSPNPHAFQSFHFGVHRALKAFQPNRKVIDRIQAKKQWVTLKQVWSNFKNQKDYRLGLAVLGAYLVINNKIKDIKHDYTNSSLHNIYDNYSTMKTSELINLLSPFWDKIMFREFRRFTIIAPKLITYLITRPMQLLLKYKYKT